MSNPIKWNTDLVKELLLSTGYEFARVKTPVGWRALGKKHLLTKPKRRLEGNCFEVSLKLALARPEYFHYCEGYAEGTPHAWVALKNIYGTPAEEDWCIDLSWPFYTMRGRRRVHDDNYYYGLRFEAEEAKKFILDRMKRLGPNTTSLSMLKYPDEVRSLIKRRSTDKTVPLTT